MKKSVKKVTASILAAMILSSPLMTSVNVFAGGDTLPPREGEQGYRGENQPGYHGYSKNAVLNWSPETDPYSDFMRASVPLQERNEEFRATQANPNLDPSVQVLSLMGDYGNEFFNPKIYNDHFSQNIFNFWQYEDIYASWHGTVVDPTPEELFVPDAPWWERKYEFGIINLPNPAYTNAAHKNGVKSIGCVFFPRTEHPQDWIYKDENGRFPLADKLVEMAKYYGFDGYFVNAEERVPADFMPLYAEFMKAMTEQGMYVQVYASNPYGQNNQNKWGGIDYYNKDAREFSNWIKKPGDETISANSLYMNPGPSKDMVDGSVSVMESLGLDAKATVFNTIEAGQTGFSGARSSLFNTLDENLVPRTGIASLGTSTCWEHLDETVFGHTGDNSYNENRRGDPDYQKYVAARERTWWSGSINQPYYTNDDKYVKDFTYLGKSTTKYTEEEKNQLAQAILDANTNPYITANNPDRATPRPDTDLEGLQYQSWPGMAAFGAEKSVIDGSNFYTNFNTGHGMQYFVDGKVSNDNEWSNINIQDILPTWQWWIESTEEERNFENAKKNMNDTLKVDFDYGTKHNAAYDINSVGGYNGGSSLVLAGDLKFENYLHLYKTDLSVNENSKVDITFNKTSKTDGSTMKLGLIFKDAPEKIEYVNIDGSGTQTNGWTTASVSLSQFAGRQIASFGLAFDPTQGEVAGYQMNIGEIRISDNSVAKPEAPTGLKIDKAFDTTETYISWDLADYDAVKQYNVYAEYEDGREVFLGGIYDDIYYIKSLYDANENVKIKVTAVAQDGTESDPAVVERNFTNDIQKIETTPKAGYIDATWENPGVEHSAIKAEVTFNYSDKTETITQMINANETNASIAVPYVDGCEYNLRLSLLDAEGNVINYTDETGNVLDIQSEKYQGTVSLSGYTLKLTPPTSNDWWHIYVKENGKYISTKDDVNYYYRGQDLAGMYASGEKGYVEVVVEDFEGNMSKPAYASYKEVVIDENMFPDKALLDAVLEQASTIEEISNITSLDLSGTNVSDLTGLNILHNLETLNLSNCTGLTSVKEGQVPASVKEVNVTGCSNLEELTITNASLEKVICEKPEDLTKLVTLNVENNKLDLSENTTEKALANVVTAQNGTVKYGGQKPVAYLAKMNDVELPKEEGSVTLLELFGKFVTINGTDYMSLQGADFIAPDYDLTASCQLANNMTLKATQTNENATYVSNTKINKNVDATYKVELIEYTFDENAEATSVEVVKDECTVVVGKGAEEIVPPEVSIKLDADKATLKVGETLKLNATVTPEDLISKLVWSSSDDKVATVKDGVVTAVAEGKAIIKAVVDGKEATCEITVTAKDGGNNGDGGSSKPEDKPNQKPDTKPDNKPNGSSPQTGDVAPIAITLGTLIVAFASGLFFFWKKRKN